MVEADTIGFANNLSIGLLNVRTMELKRIENVDENHYIFKRIKEPFDWFFYGEIMIISDSIPVARKNWNKVLSIGDLKIECKGEFVAFFHFKKFDRVNYATSLTLPEFETIKYDIKLL